MVTVADRVVVVEAPFKDWHLPELYARDPQILRTAFTHVSDLLMAELVKDMKQ